MKKKKKKYLEGTLSMHFRGFGFVKPFDLDHPDIFIPKNAMEDAIDGDTVSVEITARSGKGVEGRIVQVKKRARKRLVGLVADSLKNKDYLMYCPILGEERDVILKKGKAKDLKVGDRILMSIKQVNEDQIVCSYHSFLAPISDASKDTEIAIEMHLIRNNFSSAVRKEVEKFGISEADYVDRKDFRTWETVTIDPTTAKDFDDAISIKKMPDGKFQLAVHIADVAFYVRPGTATDREAFKRGNSTYFPDAVVPMIPSQLSDDLCSLREGVDRLTLTVLMDFNSEGKMVHYNIVRSVINSNKRFTYDEALEVLEKKKKSPHEKSLHLMVELCKLLKGKRSERGSVELSLPDLQLKLDRKGRPFKVIRHEYDITHQMIEEFMLKANETIAEHLVKTNKGGIFRIHEAPSDENLDEFFAYVRLLGFPLSSKPSETDIQELFLRAQDSPLLEQMAIRYIRSMKLAKYSSDPLGHYGLQLENYAHCTSPIRRYADLIIHRLLFEEDYDPKTLKEISSYVSDQERKSFKAESSVLKLKKMRFLDKIFDDDPYTTLKATITGLKEQGIVFDLDEIGLEGFIPIARIGKDFFTYNPSTLTITGNNTGQSFKVGQKINVEMESIDLVFQECSWLLSKGKTS